MKNIRNESGITLVALAVTIVVLMILSVSLTASMTTTIEMTRYNKIKEDIIALTEDVKVYYTKNGTLPAYTDTPINLDTHNVPANDRNPNDSGVYYPIDISVLPEDLMLNCGQGNKDKDFSTDDLYVMDSESLTVYYLKGALLNNIRHYTIVDDFSGGSPASEYYSKVDLPIISVVTMESNGTNAKRACTGDTVTLRMLTNYTLTALPVVTINNEEVTVNWNGNIGTATYKLPFTEDLAVFDKEISFSISGYEADGRSGEEITSVNFGGAVYRYAETLLVAFKNGDLQVGDYVTYTPDSTKSYPSPASENGWANQTYTVDTSTKWRVLGTEGNQVLLISADPIKKNMDADSENSWEQDPYLYMKGAYGYVNCVSMLDNICGIYSTSLGTAKSITADNINNVLGVKVESDKVYYESDPSTNIDMAGTFGKTYTYTSEDYSPESYINGKSHATEGEIVPRDGEAYAYYYDYTGTMATTIGNTTIGSLLFEGTQRGDKYAKSYWLASPGAVVGSSVAGFGPGVVDGGDVNAGFSLFNSHGIWFARRFAVRPVVYLNSDVTVEQIQETTGSTTTWSYDRSSGTEIGDASNGEAGNHGN